MTDFIIDIKTRLLEQAADLGISKETAAMLAACVDGAAKDYAGDRVYIGKTTTETRQQMTRRDRSVLRDHQAGERVALIARRYGITERRVRMIIADMKRLALSASA